MAHIDGQRIEVAKVTHQRLRGAVLTRFLEPTNRDHVEANAPELGEVLPGLKCAGVEYPDIVTGKQDFAMFKRTLPWDHAPGTFILREAGGIARRWTVQTTNPQSRATGSWRRRTRRRGSAWHRSC